MYSTIPMPLPVSQPPTLQRSMSTSSHHSRSAISATRSATPLTLTHMHPQSPAALMDLANTCQQPPPQQQQQDNSGAQSSAPIVTVSKKAPRKKAIKPVPVPDPRRWTLPKVPTTAFSSSPFDRAQATTTTTTTDSTQPSGMISQSSHSSSEHMSDKVSGNYHAAAFVEPPHVDVAIVVDQYAQMPQLSQRPHNATSALLPTPSLSNTCITLLTGSHVALMAAVASSDGLQCLEWEIQSSSTSSSSSHVVPKACFFDYGCFSFNHMVSESVRSQDHEKQSFVRGTYYGDIMYALLEATHLALRIDVSQELHLYCRFPAFVNLMNSEFPKRTLETREPWNRYAALLIKVGAEATGRKLTFHYKCDNVIECATRAFHIVCPTNLLMTRTVDKQSNMKNAKYTPVNATKHKPPLTTTDTWKLWTSSMFNLTTLGLQATGGEVGLEATRFPVPPMYWRSIVQSSAHPVLRVHIPQRSSHVAPIVNIRWITANNSEQELDIPTEYPLKLFQGIESREKQVACMLWCLLLFFRLCPSFFTRFAIETDLAAFWHMHTTILCPFFRDRSTPVSKQSAEVLLLWCRLSDLLHKRDIVWQKAEPKRNSNKRPKIAIDTTDPSSSTTSSSGSGSHDASTSMQHISESSFDFNMQSTSQQSTSQQSITQQSTSQHTPDTSMDTSTSQETISSSQLQQASLSPDVQGSPNEDSTLSCDDHMQ